ncbi:MAG: SRPBCC domain-containing protein [Pseudomonadota bacterium]
MKVETSIEIAAAPEAVWAVITDPERLVRGTGITSIKGAPDFGAHIKIQNEVAPGRTFAVTVSDFTPPKQMVWRAGMPFGLFSGVRTFTITPTEGGSRLHMQEVFKGFLEKMITRSMPDLKPSFDKFAAAVKRMSEGESP